MEEYKTKLDNEIKEKITVVAARNQLTEGHEKLQSSVSHFSQENEKLQLLVTSANEKVSELERENVSSMEKFQEIKLELDHTKDDFGKKIDVTSEENSALKKASAESKASFEALQVEKTRLLLEIEAYKEEISGHEETKKQLEIDNANHHQTVEKEQSSHRTEFGISIFLR